MLHRIRKRQVSPPGQDNRLLDDVAQLAYIPRPTPAFQDTAVFPEKNPERIPDDASAKKMQIVAGNGENIGLAFAQRRDFQIDHGYAIVEIRAEEPLPDRMGDVPVGGRDKAEVHADGLRSAHAMEAALLKDPQELGLHPRAGLREFIQKQPCRFRPFPPDRACWSWLP